jgi:hypothetical protein
MKLRKIFDQACPASTTTTGSGFRLDFQTTESQTAVVQILSNTTAPGDVALQGRLTDHPTLTSWSEITLLSNGVIQIVPRCFEYRVVVIESTGTPRDVAVWVGV